MKKILLTAYVICLALTASYAQPCAYSRPSLGALSSAQRLQLRNLILAWLNSVTVGPPTTISHWPLISMHTTMSGMIHSTGTKAFTTWHRSYLQSLENWLMNNGYPQFVPLPAWDPTTCIPCEFFNSCATGSSQVSTTVFPNLVNNCITPASWSNLIPSTACGTHVSDDDYSNDLEGSYHNGIHVAIGGAMSSVPTAPGSAIFWCYHAWIDDMWYCYQNNCDALYQDQYVRDEVADNGTEPTTTAVFWQSPDIWVRNTNDGYINQVTQNLNQYPGHICYVYIRVWQKGTKPNEDGVGTVTAYWAKGSTALAWPTPWDGTTSILCGSTSRPLGGIIGTQPLRRVNEDFYDFTMTGSPLVKDYYIYEYAWTIPDPDWYSPCFMSVADQQHFCILARLDDGHPMALTSDLAHDIHYFNNMAMRNIAIIGDGLMAPRHGGVVWGNPTRVNMNNVCLGIQFTTPDDAHLLDHAAVTVKLDNHSVNEWIGGGSLATNMTFVGMDEGFLVTGDNARLCGFNLPVDAVNTVDVAINTTVPTDAVYHLDLIQYANCNIVGGEHYEVDLGTAGGRHASSTQAPAIALQDSKYGLYPNPSKGSFQIIVKDGNYNIKASVCNELGTVVKVHNNISSVSLMDMDELPSGLYFVKIVNKDTKEESVQKLLLQR